MSNHNSMAVATALSTFQMSAMWLAQDKIRELNEEEILVRPKEGRGNILWLMGHLALGAQLAPFLNGKVPAYIPGLMAKFDTGTKPPETTEGYPAIVTLVNLYQQGVDETATAIGKMKDEDFEKAPAVGLPEPIKEYFKTRLDVITGLATHLAYHAGQANILLKILGK